MRTLTRVLVATLAALTLPCAAPASASPQPLPDDPVSVPWVWIDHIRYAGVDQFQQLRGHVSFPWSMSLCSDGGRYVFLERKYTVTGTWSKVATTRTADGGTFSFTLPFNSSAYFRTRMPASSLCPGGYSEGSFRKVGRGSHTRITATPTYALGDVDTVASLAVRLRSVTTNTPLRYRPVSVHYRDVTGAWRSYGTIRTSSLGFVRFTVPPTVPLCSEVKFTWAGDRTYAPRSVVAETGGICL